MVEVIAHIGAFFQDRACRNPGVAAGDDPQRLAAGVHVDDGEGHALVSANNACSLPNGMAVWVKPKVPSCWISRAAVSSMPKA